MSVWGAGILKGMAISLRNMFRGPITVQYPKERLELPERARWAVRMKLDEEGQHKCTACLACERACPDFIIKIDTTVGEDKTKHIDAWNYEIGACMMCGLCVEACPFDAIEMSHDYELATADPDALCEKLLESVDAAKPKRKQADRPPAMTGETQVEPVEAKSVESHALSEHSRKASEPEPDAPAAPGAAKEGSADE